MENNSLFKAIKELVKAVFLPTHGKLLKHDVDLPKEVAEYKKEILSDLKMKTAREDKINLKKDASRVKKDIKQSINDYHAEYV